MAKNQQLKKLIDLIKYKRSINQAEIAAQMGVSVTYLSDMLNGRVDFNDTFKSKLYEVFSDCVIEEVQYAGGEQSNINGDNINGNNVTINKPEIERMLDLLASKEQSLAKAQEHIDKLLVIIERLTK